MELLHLEQVVIEYLLPKKTLLGPSPRIRALNGISLRLKEGESLGIVGESGCGKSITALTLMGLLPTSMRMKGKILLTSSEGNYDELNQLTEPQLCRIRGRRIGMVFQEPMSALNPVMPIGP